MPRFCIVLLLSCALSAHAAKDTRDSERYVRADMNFLASDALQGRGSATRDELISATFIATQLQEYGIQPVNGSYLQIADVDRLQLDGAVSLSIGGMALNADQDFKPFFLSGQPASGPLNKPSSKAADKAEGIVLLAPSKNEEGPSGLMRAFELQKATLVLVGTTAKSFEQASRFAHSARLPSGLKGEPTQGRNVVLLSPAQTEKMQSLAEGTPVALSYQTKTVTAHTYNAIGMLPGADKTLRDEAILLSAHLDHLGVGKPVNGDNIYNGADDDASGVTAVLELARFLGAKERPKRTVIFVFFGSEESGGHGNRYFIEHPPVPLKNIVANLEFEMIGRADPKVAADELWLTGWERTDLGPELAHRGAKLVADPRPVQQFFQRSDNYALAKQGVVAQTVSSFGLGDYYHQPSDDLAHIDFDHLTRAIESLHKPVDWLVNTSWKPEWKPGKRP